MHSLATSKPGRKVVRALEFSGMALATAAGAWWLRHITAGPVRAWEAGAGKFVRAGRLVARVAGSGERTIVLLHGLVASGETFGRAYDELAKCGTLVVPDLLGFSRSMDAPARDFSLADHLDALDEMVEALGLGRSRFVIAGHSFGGVLALHWAARRAEQVDAVVTWGAPLFRDEAEGRAQLKNMGALEALFAHDSRFARNACELMCAHRQLARGLAIALSPDLPIEVSRHVVEHTWPAYRGAIEIFFADWQSALRELSDRNVPVRLSAGGADRSQVPHLNELLAQRYSNISATKIEDAEHIVTLTHAQACVAELLKACFAD